MTTERPICMTLDLLCALSKLTPDEREAVVDRNMLGRSLRRIAATMSLSQEGVRQLEKRGMERLRVLLGVKA